MTDKADIILYNGRIHTQDSAQPQVRAVAVKQNRITGIGCDDDIKRLKGSGTRMIDLEDCLVVPGFNDTHFHFYEWALNFDSLDLSKVTSFGRMQQMIAKKAGQADQGQWILGLGFNEAEWPENQMPDRQALDQAAPDHPVCIWRCDLHLAVANSKALELAGITKNFPDPPDGVVVKDGAGYPTGVLKELAPNLIRDVIPSLDDSAVQDNLKRAMKAALKLGLTSINDIRLMGGQEGAQALGAWQTLHRNNQMRIRCHVALPGEMTDQAVDLGLMTGFGDDFLKIGHLKFFSDGGMGARTGWMLEPYLDGGTGMPLTPVEQIESAAIKADQAGLSVMVHAIGDQASRQIIQVFRRLEDRAQSRCSIPHRIEHLQMIRPEDLAIFSTLKNVVATCQPNNMSLDISMVNQCVGENSRYAYALKSIWDTRRPMMIGSDAPVADPNPMAGIYSAVNRRRMDFTPAEGWHMEQALTVEEAVKGYTMYPALGSGTLARLGTITPGKLADMVVLDTDIYQEDTRGIAGVKVIMTLFDGEIAYDDHKLKLK